MATTLSPEAWARVSAMFDEALDLAASELPAWLARIEQADAATAAHLRALLAAHADKGAVDKLERGPQLTMDAGAESSALQPGQRIGPWKLVAPLGSGGMATVWSAARADGAYTRSVALKLPLHWRPNQAAAQRFARERDILAQLEHPNIARLYDANLGSDLLPWLAIEQVDGVPLDRWCQQQRLDLRARLLLFLQVLAAVQHAHSHLVLHLDLKAINILVTPQGQVKLLDFGIATLLHGASLGDAAEPSQRTQRVMTPAYAAPEQVESGQLSTATDIYAAGVVLFHLLTGAGPYSGDGHTPAQQESAILHGSLRPASQAFTTEAAASLGLSLKGLRQVLADDIDAILAKALQRDPARRYESAAAFAADLQRHLDGLPVLARPRTAAVVTRKFVARHRALVALAGTACMCLAAAVSVAAWQAQTAREQERRA